MHLFLPVDVRKRSAERLHFVVDVVFLTQRAHERCHLVQVVSGHSREETANTQETIAIYSVGLLLQSRVEFR